MTDSQPIESGADMSRGRPFLRLYQANERRICGLILALVPDWAQAEDLVQETAMVLWNRYVDGVFVPNPGTMQVARSEGHRQRLVRVYRAAHRAGGDGRIAETPE